MLTAVGVEGTMFRSCYRVEGVTGTKCRWVEVVIWIARVSTDHRKPDGSNSSASLSPGFGFRPKHSAQFLAQMELNYTKLTKV